jgi:hypothetical protein
MRLVLASLLVATLASCREPSAGERMQDEPPVPRVPSIHDCDAGDRAFVRRALLAVLGRHPAGQAEVDAYELALAEAENDGASAARASVVRAMQKDPGFRERWSDFFMDALGVARTGSKSLEQCYGAPSSLAFDGGKLAVYVRDNDATVGAPPTAGFTMHELMRSALELDDISVIYRAHLFATMSRQLTGNASELEVELARRNDYGMAFEAAYTNRAQECLPCHNSEYSVTKSFWPVPGLFERELFGAPSGVPASGEVSGLLRSRSMFRVLGVVGGAGRAPFGWDGTRCGTFQMPAEADPLGVDTHFGSVRGRRASVWDLERALKRGIDALAAQGLSNGTASDPDRAFASLVALNVVEKVWTEAVGKPLTIAHHFPRTTEQRDLLVHLTDSFVRSRFSLKSLLSDIVTQSVFNLLPPSAGCGEQPYALPRVFDPWTDAEQDPTKRGNSAADAVFPISPRPLRKALHFALEWPAYPEYPAGGSAEEALQLALGFALRDGEPGQRALDFQGRLAWEAAYGACEPPPGAEDFVSGLAERASNEGATVLSAVVALKDRLLGVGAISEAERQGLEGLVGGLEVLAGQDLEGKLRVVCGVMLASPWFQLGGVVVEPSAKN